jgi:small subunit ribosomal protein S21
MLVIKVGQNESIERALKKYKMKFKKCGVAQELRDRKEFVKKSAKKRKAKAKAVYIQKIRDNEEN